MYFTFPLFMLLSLPCHLSFLFQAELHFAGQHFLNSRLSPLFIFLLMDYNHDLFSITRRQELKPAEDNLKGTPSR